jgi:hypothetical protein
MKIQIKLKKKNFKKWKSISPHHVHRVQLNCVFEAEGIKLNSKIYQSKLEQQLNKELEETSDYYSGNENDKEVKMNVPNNFKNINKEFNRTSINHTNKLCQKRSGGSLLMNESGLASSSFHSFFNSDDRLSLSLFATKADKFKNHSIVSQARSFSQRVAANKNHRQNKRLKVYNSIKYIAYALLCSCFFFLFAHAGRFEYLKENCANCDEQEVSSLQLLYAKIVSYLDFSLAFCTDADDMTQSGDCAYSLKYWHCFS